VLLHEGPGSVAMWKEFSQSLAERTGYGVLVYSRPGYGQSDPVDLPRPLTYMHDEAREILPAVLDQAGVRKSATATAPRSPRSTPAAAKTFACAASC
jgi:pimeloyl-ACP methyl ester carboxylesterase